MIEDIASQNIDFDRIKKMLSEGKNPIVKFGIDPTSPNLHIGHLVPLMAFIKLLSMGCRGVIILGDMTAQIGDPSGLEKSRPTMSHDETKKNGNELVEQLLKFLPDDKSSFKIIFNSAIKPSIEKLFSLTQKVSINSMLGRDHFSARHKNGDSISLLEMICPILQAWDSICLRPDLEIGGNDQFSNCVLARDLMEKSGIEKQSILLFPILTGTDGSKKMSKSLGNHVSVNDSPEDVFGKTMSIPDHITEEWLNLLFHEPLPFGIPLKDKEWLAQKVTSLIHGNEGAVKAAQWFEETFRNRNVEATETFIVVSGSSIIDVLVLTNLSSSRSEAKRLISGNGVKIDGNLAKENDTIISNCVIQKGRRTAIGITVK